MIYSIRVTATAETAVQARLILAEMEEAVGKHDGELIDGDIKIETEDA